MARIRLLDMARMTVTGTPGTGAITLNAAVANHITFSAAGGSDGDLIVVGIKDGTAQSINLGVLSSSATVLTIVDTIHSTTGSQLSLTSAAEVFSSINGAYLDKIAVQETPPDPGVDGFEWLDIRNWERYVTITDSNGDSCWVSAKAATKQNRLRLVESKGLATGTSWSSDTQNGDLIVAFAFRDGSTTAPTLGTGFTSIASGSGTSCSYRTQYRLATADNEVFSGFTNATSMQFLVFRMYDGGAPIGASNSANGVSTTVTVPSLTKTKPDNRSFMAFFFGHRSTDVDAYSSEFDYFARAGFTDDGTTDTTNAYWTPRPWQGNYSGTTLGVNGTSSGWISSIVEIQGQSNGDWSLPPGNPTQNDTWAGCYWDGEKWTAPGQTGIKAFWTGGYTFGGLGYFAQQWEGLVGMADLGNVLVLYTEERTEDNVDHPYCVVCNADTGAMGVAYMGVRELWLYCENASNGADVDYLDVMITWGDNNNAGQNNWFAPKQG